MKELRLFIDEMQATSSSLDKVAILKRQSKFIQKVLEYTYNPYKQYHVTSKTCKKNIHLHSHCNHTLFGLLDILTNREATGHDAIKMINRFASKNVDWDIIYDKIDTYGLEPDIVIEAKLKEQAIFNYGKKIIK